MLGHTRSWLDPLRTVVAAHHEPGALAGALYIPGRFPGGNPAHHRRDLLSELVVYGVSRDRRFGAVPALLEQIGRLAHKVGVPCVPLLQP